jgi:hypothetical protein
VLAERAVDEIPDHFEKTPNTKGPNSKEIREAEATGIRFGVWSSVI